MHLEVVYDNQGLAGFKSGWGFACLMGDGILFDTGEKGRPLLANLRRLGVSTEDIRAVVISHDHWDHTGGLRLLLKKRQGLRVYACPGFGRGFFHDVKKMGGRPVAVAPGMEIAPGVVSTGEVAGTYKGLPMPEQALAMYTQNGLSVVTGCSHPGILTMVQAAINAVPDRPLVLVLGGFHLKDHGAIEIHAVADALLEMGAEQVAPTHCTGDRGVHIFRERFGKRCLSVAAGTVLEI